ncbi:MAG: hypothetical protein KJS97_12830 [Alphaproteobacteria bacterium]|nr:hypothetical protein [Alphaproteobacteria bacterium]
MTISSVVLLAAVSASAVDSPPRAGVATIGVDEVVATYPKPIGPPVAIPTRAALFAAAGPAEAVQVVNETPSPDADVPLATAPQPRAKSLLPRMAMLGRRLDGLVDEYKQPNWDKSDWYLFAGTDGQAMTWAPRAAHDLQIQDRIVVGELQAGVSYQTGPLQASVAYMEHEVSNTQRTDRQGFAGVSFTYRR